MARRNQLLPWSWDNFTPIDLQEIADLLWSLPASAPNLEKEAAFAIASILTTGRKLSYLIGLSVFDTEDDMRLAAVTQGLIANGGKSYWRLVAGSPKRQDERRPRKDGRERYQNDAAAYIPFVLEPVARHCFKRVSSNRLLGARPLLTFSAEELTPVIERMLKNRRQGPVPPRRSSCTIESLERFLTLAITHQGGGDIGASARFTDSDEVMSRSVIHYGASNVSSTITRSRNATAILNRGLVSSYVKGVRAGKVGSTRTPTWSDVRDLIAATESYLEQKQNSREMNHIAMTFYTVALLSFALGHRGRVELFPGSAAIDPVSGFCKIHDKARSDPSKSRLVWVAPVAVAQVAAYEEHVLSLREHLPEGYFSQIVDTLASGRLPLFVFRKGVITHVTISRVWNTLNKHLPRPNRSFVFHDNCGRHWLRSELESKCSTETLHAFFGHWQNGTEPWTLGSCFDPLLYRADLQSRLPGVLDRVGWHARRASGTPL